MLRSLFLTTALVGIAGSAAAQGVHVNGVYTPTGGSISVPADGTVTLGAQPTLGMTYEAAGHHGYQSPAIHGAPGGQYEVTAPAPVVEGHQTYTVTPGSSQTFTIPGGQNSTYNVVVPSTAAPAPTYAQPAAHHPAPHAVTTGWKARGVYIGARAGTASQRNTDFTVAAQHGAPRADIDTAYETGHTGSLVVGYGARPAHGAGWGYRVELEGGYQSASVESHTVRGVGKFAGKKAQGDSKVVYGFVNAYGDLPITERVSLTAGGGVGVGHVDFDEYGILGSGVALDDSATAFGYHLDAGVSYQLTDAVAVEAMYRYQSFVGAKVKTENGNEQSIDLDSHNVLAGVRVGF